MKALEPGKMGEGTRQPAVGRLCPRLEFKNLSKTFGSTRALKNVTFTVHPAEVHALVGQNGSGKSTLIKILAGYHNPDSGAELWIDGKPVRLPMQPGKYRQYGISFVHQELALILSITVLENLRAEELCLQGKWYISWKEEIRAAKDLLSRFELDIDPLAKVEDIAPGSRALLAIVRAVEAMRERGGLGEGGVLVLDEPTAFLPREDVERLFSIMRLIVAQGASVIFVSHDVDEVLEIADRITVIRDGSVVATVPTNETTKEALVEKIVGHPLPAGHGKKLSSGSSNSGIPKIIIRGLTGGSVKGISIEAHRGEILGLTGLLGSGFSDIPPLLFGAMRATEGRLILDNVSYELRAMNPCKAIEARLVLIPVDRRSEGLVEALTVVENMSLPILRKFNRWRLNHAGIVRNTRTLIADYEIRPADPQKKVGELSGGNQQKVLLAKWLQTKPLLVLLNEPTHGVDVGAREQIYGILKRQAASGTTVLCASSDCEELAMICNRVLIFSRGEVVEELAAGELVKEHIAQRTHIAGSSLGERATENG
jgi:ribose transport system ATP-binding protein